MLGGPGAVSICTTYFQTVGLGNTVTLTIDSNDFAEGVWNFIEISKKTI